MTGVASVPATSVYKPKRPTKQRIPQNIRGSLHSWQVKATAQMGDVRLNHPVYIKNPQQYALRIFKAE